MNARMMIVGDVQVAMAFLTIMRYEGWMSDPAVYGGVLILPAEVVADFNPDRLAECEMRHRR